jgi:uncharacterized protein YdeI (YjbR/CyaY-like superfamily)
VAKPRSTAVLPKPSKPSSSSKRSKQTTSPPRAKPAVSSRAKPATRPGNKPAASSRPSATAASATYPEQSFANPAEFSAWLARHHATSTGIALRIGRKGGGAPSISYAQALDVALAWGWIDGQKAAGDATAWIQRFGPRTPRSIWSKINRDKALAMIERGEMKPAGLAAIEQAKANGRWDEAYDSPRTAAVPDDLAAALDASPPAKAAFAGLDSANRYAILVRVHHAKQAATRARRIEQLVAMLARGETLHPPRRRRG